MRELVTIRPDAGRDSDGDPLADGAPFDVRALEVAPGNTLRAPRTGGDLDSADFTVFLPLRIRAGDTYVVTSTACTENFSIVVRGRTCRGRLQEWKSGGRGGCAVLALSRSGKGA